MFLLNEGHLVFKTGITLLRIKFLSKSISSLDKSWTKEILLSRQYSSIFDFGTFNYLLARNPWQGKFHISTIPHDSYERRVLFPHKYKDVHQYVASLIDNLEQDPLWMSYINNYN